jgi:c-di-GMP-binding flagellar brake protein YcgR
MIERNARRGIGVRSTNLLRPGQSLAISLEGEGEFDSKVVSNMRDLLACRSPRSSSGQEMRWRRGTRLRALFWRESDAGYTFQTKVLGYDSIKGLNCILIQHSKTLRREQQRRFRRSPLHRPCFYYPINIASVKEGRRTVRKAIVQNRQRRLGNLLDISAGGCSITGMKSLKPGSLLRMEFEINRTQRITVFGKVRRVRNQPNQGGIMHIMFTKLSSHMLNLIYSYVYDYAPSLRSLLSTR